MVFQIDFNREKDDKTLEAIGAIEKSFFNGEFDIYYHEIEIEHFKELELILTKIDFIKKDNYSHTTDEKRRDDNNRKNNPKTEKQY